MEFPDGDSGQSEPEPVPNLVVLRGRSSSPYNVTVSTVETCFESMIPKLFPSSLEPVGPSGTVDTQVRDPWTITKQQGAAQTGTKQILKLSDRTKTNKNENLGPSGTNRSLGWMVRGSLTQA